MDGLIQAIVYILIGITIIWVICVLIIWLFAYIFIPASIFAGCMMLISIFISLVMFNIQDNDCMKKKFFCIGSDGEIQRNAEMIQESSPGLAYHLPLFSVELLTVSLWHGVDKNHAPLGFALVLSYILAHTCQHFFVSWLARCYTTAMTHNFDGIQDKLYELQSSDQEWEGLCATYLQICQSRPSSMVLQKWINDPEKTKLEDHVQTQLEKMGRAKTKFAELLAQQTTSATPQAMKNMQENALNG